MPRLPVEIDKEVFKFKDDRVTRLRTGKVSTDQFAFMLRPSDPFVLIGNTVYALSEQEWYAIRSTLSVNIMTDRIFEYVLGLEDLSFMHDIDKQFIQELRDNKAGCSACRYSKYKNEVWKLVKKYNIKLPEGMIKLPENIQPDLAEYPATSAKVEPKVSSMLHSVYEMPVEERKACIDCVEKHLSQAYILSLEYLQGYPEYITFVIGHISEALDEMPRGFKWAHDTLEFMLARTKCFREPFVPINIIIPLLSFIRHSLSQAIEDQQDMDDNKQSAFELDLTEDNRKELMSIDIELARKLMHRCDLIHNFALKVGNSGDEAARISWEGSMASLSDAIAHFAPQTANIIRNRRLLFVVNPALSIEAGFDVVDVKDALLERVGSL